MLPPRLVAVALAVAVALTVVTIWLTIRIPDDRKAHHLKLVWAGLDVFERCAVAATAWTVWRRSQWTVVAGAVTGGVLLCDAWFNIMTEVGTAQVSALAMRLVELPIAAAALVMGNPTRLLRRQLLGDELTPGAGEPVPDEDEPAPEADEPGEGDDEPVAVTVTSGPAGESSCSASRVSTSAIATTMPTDSRTTATMIAVVTRTFRIAVCGRKAPVYHFGRRQLDHPGGIRCCRSALLDRTGERALRRRIAGGGRSVVTGARG
ncbi:MAG: hypothetical protein JO147_13050 [Actinobacteria bacterium]|nr:hypothetical protein [Actinomycetota bacterium]